MKAWQKPMVLIVAAGCVLVTLRSSDAATNYVAQNGQTPSGSYTSWDTAASNIPEAVSTAAAGNTVLVSNGTYVVTNRVTIGNVILKSVNGREATIVDGGNYVGRATTNSCFLMNNDSAVIDGFTISNGYAVGSHPDKCGGGVRLSRGTLRNSWIRDCTAAGGYGGGIYCDTAVAVLISNCVVSGNSFPSQGGGVCNAVSVPLTIVDCVISNNTSTGSSGGGILLNSGGVMRNCTVTANQAAYAGGVHVAGGTVSNCVISANTCTDNNTGGGGVMLSKGVVSCSTITLNRARAAGGGFHVQASGGTIRDCTITENASTNSSAGGIYLYQNGNIVNCLIAGNRAGTNTTHLGGGIYAYDISKNTGTVSSCTIVSNTAYRGGGLAFSTGANNTNAVSNCVIYANANVTNGFATDVDIYANAAANSNAFAFCCSSYAGFPAGRGNITADPLFVNAAGSDYHLQAGSPCIDAGSDQEWMNNALDLDGRPRIRYATVDIGCYEHIRSGTIFSFH